jgi:hypothetical protein
MRVFVSSLGPVLFVDLRDQQIVLILFLREQFNINIVNIAVKYEVRYKFAAKYKGK